jgi:hypothetical protein
VTVTFTIITTARRRPGFGVEEVAEAGGGADA